jgi:glycosyltransferase involved in cell wall biosynthesis
MHITTVHVASDTRIVHKECKSLVDAGYDVTLLAASDAEVPVTGIRVLRLLAPRSRWDRWTRLAWQALVTALRERAALYHVHDPELIPVALVMKALGRRVVYDAHEHVPRQIMDKVWISPFIRKPLAALAGAVEALADRVLDGIIVANPSTAPRFDPRHTALVQNFARIPSEDDPPSLDQRPRSVIYVGGVSRHRGVHQMLEAIRLLGRPDVRLTLIGPLEPGLGELDLDGISDRVELKGLLHRHEVDALLRRAWVGLSVLQPVPNFVAGHYPTKLFEYMAARMPVIASDFPLYREVVDEAGSGLLVDPTSPAQIAEAIAQLLDHPDAAQAMADRGRATVLHRYSWAASEKTLLAFYRQMLDQS